MKLTTKQIREIIKEELKAVLEGRTIIAPGPIHKHLLDPDSQYEIDRRDKGGKDKWERRYEYRPGQRGSNIVYECNFKRASVLMIGEMKKLRLKNIFMMLKESARRNLPFR